MKLNRRKFVTQSAGLGLSLTSLAHAQSGPTTGKILLKAKTLSGGFSLTILYPKGSLGNLRPVIKSFTEGTGIKVIAREASLNNIATEMRLENNIHKNKKYDIALPPTFHIPDLAEEGIITDLTDLMKKCNPSMKDGDIMYTRGNYYKGRFFGHQADGDTYLMFYNKSFIENKKLKKQYEKQYKQQLKIPLTWEELDRQIKFFHGNGLHGGNLYRNKEYSLWEFWIRLHSQGIYPFDKNMNSNLNHPLAAKALEDMIKITPYLDPRSQNDSLFDNFKHFSEGKSYCNLGWGGTQKYLNGPNSKIKDQLLFSPPPGGTHKEKTFFVPYFNWGWNYTVNKKSPQIEAAYLFCLYATSAQPSSDAISEASGYFDPIRKSHYKDKRIQKIYGPDFLKAHRYCLENSIPDLYLQGQANYLGSLKQSLWNALNGILTPKESLMLVHNKWNLLTKKHGKNEQLKQWNFLKNSYPQQIKDILDV